MNLLACIQCLYSMNTQKWKWLLDYNILCNFCFQHILEPFSKLLSIAVTSCSFHLNQVLDICSLGNRVFSRVRLLFLYMCVCACVCVWNSCFNKYAMLITETVITRIFTMYYICMWSEKHLSFRKSLAYALWTTEFSQVRAVIVFVSD